MPKLDCPVLIVDEDDRFRASLATVLDQAGYVTMAAATGEEALELAENESPRLVILDVCLPGISGYQVCRDLRDRFGADLPIIFITGVRTESFDRVAGLLVGADDYLEKPFAPDELLIRVDHLIRRKTPLVPAVASKLTPREREILALLADGLRAREIEERLSLSPRTVRTHIENILRKLGVHSRAQAVALAYQQHLLGTRS